MAENKRENINKPEDTGEQQCSDETVATKPVIETFYSLIACTILRHGPMCVSEIYKALAATGESKANQANNWKNSVRHALSYKKYFNKGKGNTRHGRGCLWTVNEELFLLEQHSKKSRKRLKSMTEIHESTRKRNQKFAEFACRAEKLLKDYYSLEVLEDSQDKEQDKEQVEEQILFDYADI